MPLTHLATSSYAHMNCFMLMLVYSSCSIGQAKVIVTHIYVVCF